MLNPFTHNQFQLPSQSTLPDQFDYDSDDAYTDELRNLFTKEAFLSYDDSVAMIIFSPQRRLAFVRPGDEFWTSFSTETVNCVDDVIFYRGKFCCVNQRGNVMECHIDSTPPNAVKIIGDFKHLYDVDKYYLVEWMGKLLLVTRYVTRYDEEPFYATQRFQVYVYDFDVSKWEEIWNLGHHSLFLGFNTSGSLLILEHSPFRRNSIYFTDDNTTGFYANDSEGGHDMGVFDLHNRTIKPHYDGISTSFYSPPLWITPKSLSQ